MDLTPLLVTFLCLCVNAQVTWDCMVQGSKGQCVNLDKCNFLKSKLIESKRDKNIYDLLKKFQCGYENKDPKVCCPMEGFDVFMVIVGTAPCRTPDGDVGTCTKAEECNKITEQVNNSTFLTPDTMCTSPESDDSVHVCCKSEASSPSPGTSPRPDDRILNQCVLSAFPPRRDSQCCGIDSNGAIRIIGGKEAGLDQFPWLVLIDYTRPQLNCGGSLISGRYVLTAAHCLVGSKGKDRGAVSVRIGEFNKTNPGPDCIDSPGGGQDCTDGHINNPIESYVIHKDYSPDNVVKYNDIALIRLKDIVNFTDFSRPICLPESDFTNPPPPSNLTLLISGWGIVNVTRRISSDVKVFADVPYITKEKCNVRFAKLGKQSLSDTQLCVGGEKDKDSCEGDSGGPLMLLDGLTHEAVGVISFGVSACGLQGWPSIYTKVFDYLDWITENIKP